MRAVVVNWLMIGLLLLLLGCPKGPSGNADGAAGIARGQGAVKAEVDPNAPGPSTENLPGEAAPTAAAASEPATEQAAPVTKEQLAGTWLALFGRGDRGVNEKAYVNGHELQINPDGTLLLTLLKDGKSAQQLPGVYTIEKDRFEWTYYLTAAVDSGAIDYAPLGMGRDEEIGLLKSEQDGMGRDDEIGLLKSEQDGMGRDAEIGLEEGKSTGQGAAGKHTEELRIVLDGPFMALTDDHGQIYVYGNEALRQPEGMLFPPGMWAGLVHGKQIRTSFMDGGGTLEAQLGEYGGLFRAEAANGFFTGHIEGQPKLSLAAVVLLPSNQLSGVLLTDPYAKLDPQFDFTLAP